MKLHDPLLVLALTGLSLCACGKTNRIVAPSGDDPLSSRPSDRDAEVFAAAAWSWLVPNEDLPRSDPANSDPWHTWPFGRIYHWNMIDEIVYPGEDTEFIHASLSPPHGVYGKQIDRYGFTDLQGVGNIVVDGIKVQMGVVIDLRGCTWADLTVRYYIGNVLKNTSTLSYYGQYGDEYATTWTAEFGAPGFSAADIANLQVEVEAENGAPASIEIYWMQAGVHHYPKVKPPPIPTE